MKKVVLPELGEGITKATVSFWFFKAGDTVKEHDDLVELTTDKAAFNLPSPASGTLTQVLCAEGQSVSVGETLGIIE
jgi:pyruvate/2-oxoglutarate dehydrogenase complex dihydrolipoamide acyltransferase (E2) component